MRYIGAFILAVILLSGCSKSSETNYAATGKVQLLFSHQAGQQPLLPDTLLYLTATRHQYKVADLQYFVSDFTLYHNGGKPVRILSGQGIHYVDMRVAGTLGALPTGSPRQPMIRFPSLLGSIRPTTYPTAFRTHPNATWPGLAFSAVATII